MPRVSVVVISKDEPPLSVTLAVLREQCVDVDAECVVVDASMGRLGRVRDDHPWVRWHDYVGPADRLVTIPHQRNVGVEVAKGDVIAFCDAGGVPASSWLSNLTAPILEGNTSATAGPISSRRRCAYGTLNDLPTGAVVRRVVTCNFAFSRALFHRVGGFDERFDYGSDSEFGWRIEEAGEQVVSVSDAVVTIDWGSRRRQLKRDLRYGEAKVRQFLLCPAQRRRILQESPEVFVYPLLFLTLPLAVIAALVAERPALVVPWALGCAILLARDLWCRRPLGSMLDHVVVSIGIGNELARASLVRLRQGVGERVLPNWSDGELQP